MINAIEYVTERKGVLYALSADKNVTQNNAWHLARISGNGMPPTSALGGASYGVVGRSYNGLAVDAREIEVEMYADGFSPAGCQQLLNEASHIFSTDNEALGILKLTNAAGERFRIAAKAVDFSINASKRRSALVDAVFHCPYAYFESDVLQSAPLFAIEGGKEYPINEGLERPYTFGNVTKDAAEHELILYNAGDVAAPCTIKLFGAGLSNVEIVNETTGAAIIVSGMSVGGIEIGTDENNLYARFDDGADASAYVSLFSDIASFNLAPGANALRVNMEASSVTAAGTSIEWRGRYSLCL